MGPFWSAQGSTGPHWTVTLVAVSNETLTEEGGADGAGRERYIVGNRGRQGILTSSHCGGYNSVFLTPSSSDSGSDSDGVLSSLLQTRQCVHCLTTSNVRDHGVRASETVSVSGRVGDGV